MQPDQMVTVTLSAQDWQVVVMGLGEVPLKYSAVVDARLRQQLQAAETGLPASPGNGAERQAPPAP